MIIKNTIKSIILMEVVAVRNGEEEQYVVNKKNKLWNITNHSNS